MFNINDVYKDQGLYLCVFHARSEETAKNYCERHASMIQGLAGNVALRHEGNKVILSSARKNLTAHAAKLLNGYVKKIF